MERLQIREISRLLAQDQHIAIGDAERFVNEMFGIVADGLKADKQVIVNGLGTFKQTSFKGKESVHFTPDTELAAAVNAPFANFKTVEITAEEEPEETVNEAVAEETVEVTPAEEPKEEAKEDKPEEKVEEKVEALTEKVEALSEQIEQRKRARKHTVNKAVMGVVAAIILAIIGGAYHSIQKQNEEAEEAEQKRLIAEQKAAEQKHRQDSINRIKANIASLDLTDEQKREIVGKGNPNAPEYPCALSLEEAKQLVPRAGYKITGTVTVFTVGEGMTMKDVAQEYGLQQGEFLIQVYNAIESVKEGQKLRIPLVEIK